MNGTYGSVALKADHAIDHFGFHCSHEKGHRSFRMTDSGGLTIFLQADSATELRQLSDVLADAAERWERELDNERMV